VDDANAPAVDELVAQLTREEKVALTAGYDLWHTPGVERAGIAPLKVSDGPNGARGARWGAGGSLCFPCGTALGATWDVDLVREVGAALGDEVRDKRAHVHLAPTVNLHRHPLAGRNFECYSEDPFLSARMAVAYITGVQSRGVGSCVKHFVANDQEHERMTISAVVDERVLRELYLVPFEAAVREAKAWAVMSAYNRLHGTYCSEHPWLLRTLLKEEWGFDGIVMSDWFGTHSGAAAANAGLDLEMPGPPQWLGDKLLPALERGEVAPSVLDEIVGRLLVLRGRVGARPVGGEEIDDERSVDEPARRAVARRAAASSFVLLRNEGLLPLDLDATATLAVIGPNADAAMLQGGGSASVTPHRPVAPLDALRERGGAKVRFERGTSIGKRTPVLDTRRLDGQLRIEYFAGRELGGEPVYVEEARRGYFVWLGRFAAAVPDDFSVRVTGTFVAEEDGAYTFSLVQAGRARLRLDGDVVVDNWQPEGRSEAFFGFGSTEARGDVTLAAGERRTVAVEFVPGAPGMGGLMVGVRPPEPPDLEGRAVALAREADAVVLVVGTDADWESEGHDRESMRLPGEQDALVERVVEANPRTVVVVNAASPIEMDWAERVAAVMQVWFPGEELGNALADVLFGDVPPAGRLPTTIPFRLEDAPAHPWYPGHDGKVEYGEGLLVGYRGFDARGTEPRYPFGHGLTYTTFEHGVPQVSPETFPGDGDVEVEVVVPVTNTGTRRAAEVVQCYVHDVEASVERPAQELRAFAKVELDPGETQPVRLTLGPRAFAYWDVGRGDWFVEPGAFELRIGASSRDIRQRVTVQCR
jgi:beta-glucosidase